VERQTEAACTEPRAAGHLGGCAQSSQALSWVCAASATEICEGPSSHFAFCSPGISRDARTLQYLQGNIKSGMLCVIYSAACHAVNGVRLLLKWHELRKWAEGLRDWGCWSRAAVVAVEAGPCFSGSKLD